MSDTELDVSSLGSQDEGALVFPSEGEEEEEQWESAEEEEEPEDDEEQQQPTPSPREGADSAVQGGEEPITPGVFLVVPDDDVERSRSSIAITVPAADEEGEVERVSVASSFVSTEEPRPRRTPTAPPFSIRDAPFNEGVVTAVEETSTLQPPTSAVQGRRQRSSSPERSVTFTPDLPKYSKKKAPPPASAQPRKSRRETQRGRNSSASSESPAPIAPSTSARAKEKRKEKPTTTGKKRHGRSFKRTKKRLKRDLSQQGIKTSRKTSEVRRQTPSPRRSKKKLDIAIHGVTKFSDVEASDVEDYAPPKHLSPRSAAEYVKSKLKEAAARRKKRKRKRKGKKGRADTPTGKKKRKKKRHGKKKRRKPEFGDSEEDAVPRPQKPLGPGDQHFYPTPQNLFKKRCLFSVEPKPVVCSICDGIHYRTKRNFAANIKIIINVNRALTDILNEMRNRMKKIDNNLARVKRNLDYLEEMYEGVFRKVNRLIS